MAALIPDGLPRGPRRLLELLHQIAVSTMAARAYPVVPSQVTIHLPQELLAAALGCSLRSLYNWTQVLKRAGLLDARAHFTSSKGVTRIDGTLFAVALQQGHRAHLTHDDLSHQWRDLDGDRAAGRTAYKAFAGSDPKTPDQWKDILRAWAVTPGSVTDLPVFTDPANAPSTVRDVVYMLPLLQQAHATKRPALVGLMASTLAHALHDHRSRRWYCRLIWDAWIAEVEGRAGLQVLAAQLARLQGDIQEGAPWRNPAALFTARMNKAVGTPKVTT